MWKVLRFSAVKRLFELFKSNTDHAYLVMEFLNKRMVVPIKILENRLSVWHTMGNELLSYAIYPWMFVPQAFTHKHGKCLSCASAVQETFSHLSLEINLRIHPAGHVTIAVWSWSEVASSSLCQDMGKGKEERDHWELITMVSGRAFKWKFVRMIDKGS